MGMLGRTGFGENRSPARTGFAGQRAVGRCGFEDPGEDPGEGVQKTFQLIMPQTLCPNDNSTVDLTSVNAKATPTGAILFGSSALTVGVNALDFKMSMGIADGTTQGGGTSELLDGFSPLETDRVMYNDAVLTSDAIDSDNKLSFDSFLSTGIRLQNSRTDGAGSSIRAIMPTGTGVLASKAMSFNVGGMSLNVEGTFSFGVSDTTDYNYFIFQFFDVEDTGISTTEGDFSFGMATYKDSNIVQYTVALRPSRNLNEIFPERLTSEDYVAVEIQPNGAQTVWAALELTTVGSGSIGLTPRAVTPPGANVKLLVQAFQIDSTIDFKLMEVSLPNQVGKWTHDGVGFKPSSYFGVFSMYSSLPSIIPTEFGGAGCVTGWNDEGDSFTDFNCLEKNSQNALSGYNSLSPHYPFEDGTYGTTSPTNQTGYVPSANPTANTDGIEQDFTKVNAQAGGCKGFLIFFSNGAPTVPSITENLVRYFKLDEASGTVVTDSSDNAQDLTNDGATVNQTGKVDKSYLFDGVNDFLHSSSTTGFTDSTIFTWCAWIKTTSTTTLQCIYKRADSDARLFIYQGKQIWLRVGVFDVKSNIDTNISDGAWHHIAVTKRGDNTGEIVFYLDGVSFGGGTGTHTSGSGAELQIGRDSSSWPFNGDIDEVRDYERALTIVDINGLPGF